MQHLKSHRLEAEGSGESLNPSAKVLQNVKPGSSASHKASTVGKGTNPSILQRSSLVVKMSSSASTRDMKGKGKSTARLEVLELDSDSTD